MIVFDEAVETTKEMWAYLDTVTGERVMDIVERLTSHWGGERCVDVSIDVADAIDEIKRLRVALKELLNVVPNFPPEGNVLVGMKERYKKALIEARAALKEKE